MLHSACHLYFEFHAVMLQYGNQNVSGGGGGNWGNVGQRYGMGKQHLPYLDIDCSPLMPYWPQHPPVSQSPRFHHALEACAAVLCD